MEKRDAVRTRLKDATACVCVRNEPVCTAFVVSEHYLVSSGHSFTALASGTKISVRFFDGAEYPVSVALCRFSEKDGADFAFLRCGAGLENRPALPMLPAGVKSGEVELFGLSRQLGDVLTPASGRISGIQQISGAQGTYHLKIQSSDAGQYGFSGSPIYHVEKNGVVGIQSQATDNDVGAESATVLAFPAARIYADKDPEVAGILREMKSYPPLSKRKHIEQQLLPTFGRLILNLDCTDRLDAYMRCVVVKFLPEERKRFTLLVAEGERGDPLYTVYRPTHRTRNMNYGIVGGAIRAGVSIIYDFEHDVCYKRGLGGSAEKTDIVGKKTRGTKDNRIALLVAPVLDQNRQAVGVLSFDFFPTQKEGKSITHMISSDKDGEYLSRILYYADEFAAILAAQLLYDIEDDIDFYAAQP